MEALKLTQQETQTVGTFVSAYKAMDKSSLGVFKVCSDFFSRNKEAKTKAVRTALTKEMNKVIINEDSNIKTRLSKVVGVAVDFLGYKLDETDMYFNRIESIATLLKFFADAKEPLPVDTFDTAKARLEKVIGAKFEGIRDYNEALTVEIDAIKKDNKIEDSEALVFKGTIDDFIKLALAYNEEDRAKLVKALTA